MGDRCSLLGAGPHHGPLLVEERGRLLRGRASGAEFRAPEVSAGDISEALCALCLLTGASKPLTRALRLAG